MYDVITENLTDKNFTEKKLQIDFKWSEMHKKTQNRQHVGQWPSPTTVGGFDQFPSKACYYKLT